MPTTIADDPADTNPFHTSNWPRAIADPADYDGGERLTLGWDLGATDSESDKKRLIKAWCQLLPELGHVRRLVLWSHVTPPLFEAACRMHDLDCLVIKWSSIRDLSPIAGLRQLRFLYIGSSTKVTSIEALASLGNLRQLHMENFKLITDFSPLTRLTRLESLTISGSMWSRQTVASLEPLATMTWLHALAVDTSHVDSLRPLANLTGLAALDVGGRLPMEEYAWLAARLPATECRWFQPWLELAHSGIGLCRKCGRESMVMLTGRGKGTLCRHCDQAKVDRHAAAFAAARSRALAGSP